jgi:hypothetical protein
MSREGYKTMLGKQRFKIGRSESPASPTGRRQWGGNTGGMQWV